MICRSQLDYLHDYQRLHLSPHCFSMLCFYEQTCCTVETVSFDAHTNHPRSTKNPSGIPHDSTISSPSHGTLCTSWASSDCCRPSPAAHRASAAPTTNRLCSSGAPGTPATPSAAEPRCEGMMRMVFLIFVDIPNLSWYILIIPDLSWYISILRNIVFDGSWYRQASMGKSWSIAPLLGETSMNTSWSPVLVSFKAEAMLKGATVAWGSDHQRGSIAKDTTSVPEVS